MTQNTEVQKVDPLKVPAFIGSKALGKGFEDETESNDYVIPRCKLVQFTSEETTAVDISDRIEPGKLVNNITKQEVSPFFIPCFRYKSFAKWNPMDKRTEGFDSNYAEGELIFSTTDKNDPRIGDGLEFGEDGTPPVVTEIWNYLCLFPNESMPLILSFKRTSLRSAKELNTMMQILGGDMFDGKYRLITIAHQEGQRKWYTISVKGAGTTSPEEKEMALSIYNHFRNKGASVADVVEKHAQKEEGFTD